MKDCLDLKKFCDETRPELAQPFSFGEWTFATNGHICLRAPRRDDIPENSVAPKALALFEQFSARPRYKPAPQFELGQPFEWNDEEGCPRCAGSGKRHSCSDCQHQCQFCDGTGKYFVPQFRRIALGTAIYNAKYLSWLQELPGLQLGQTHRKKPLPFRFEGGDGLLMPCSREAT